MVDALTEEGCLSGLRQARTAREDEVEDDGPAGVGLAPDAEVACELLAQAVGLGGGADREAHGTGRAHVGRAAHLSPEVFAQNARYRRELRSAAGDVESIERELRMRGEQALDDLTGGFD